MSRPGPEDPSERDGDLSALRRADSATGEPESPASVKEQVLAGALMISLFLVMCLMVFIGACAVAWYGE